MGIQALTDRATVFRPEGLTISGPNDWCVLNRPPQPTHPHGRRLIARFVENLCVNCREPLTSVPDIATLVIWRRTRRIHKSCCVAYG